MTLPSSGALSLNSIQGEFGGSNPIGLNEYYRGGSLVPNHSNTSSIPTSGTIDVQDFYGTSASSPIDLSFTFNMSGLTDVPQGKFINRYVGYLNSSYLGTAVGSASDTSLAVNGTSISVVASAHPQASGYPNYTGIINGLAWFIVFGSATQKDAILTGRSGANFQGLGNENWQTGNSGFGTPMNVIGSSSNQISWGSGLGTGENSTELARVNRFSSWANGRTGQNTTVTFY